MGSSTDEYLFSFTRHGEYWLNSRYYGLRAGRIRANIAAMNIKRTLFSTIQDKLSSTRKIIILYGARQVGKTTLINDVLGKFSDSGTPQTTVIPVSECQHLLLAHLYRCGTGLSGRT